MVKISLEEYFKFLEEYWILFGPIPTPKKMEYKNLKI